MVVCVVELVEGGCALQSGFRGPRGVMERGEPAGRGSTFSHATCNTGPARPFDLPNGGPHLLASASAAKCFVCVLAALARVIICAR